ncbi:hypothetical protein Tco_1550836, partial [Tanacetum coccineum]
TQSHHHQKLRKNMPQAQAVVISQSSPKESTHKGFHLGRKNVGRQDSKPAKNQRSVDY